MIRSSKAEAVLSSRFAANVSGVALPPPLAQTELVSALLSDSGGCLCAFVDSI